MSELPVIPETTESAVNGRPRSQPVVVFGLALLVALLSLGSPILLITRTAVGSADVEPEVTSTFVATSSPRTATPVPAPVRVVTTSGSAEALGSGNYRVTFAWVLEGARERDVALIRFSAGSRMLSEQRGTLDANVFTTSTGRLAISTQQECSSDGWTAELVTLRGRPLTGEATARVAGVKCS